MYVCMYSACLARTISIRRCCVSLLPLDCSKAYKIQKFMICSYTYKIQQLDLLRTKYNSLLCSLQLQSFDHCLPCIQLSRCFSTPTSLYRISFPIQDMSFPLIWTDLEDYYIVIDLCLTWRFLLDLTIMTVDLWPQTVTKYNRAVTNRHICDGF